MTFKFLLACPDMTVLCSSSLRRYKTPASCNSPAVSFPKRHHGSSPHTYASRRYLEDHAFFNCVSFLFLVVVVDVGVVVAVVIFPEKKTRNKKKAAVGKKQKQRRYLSIIPSRLLPKSEVVFSPGMLYFAGILVFPNMSPSIPSVSFDILST